MTQPDDVPNEHHRAKLFVKIYHGDGLPQTDLVSTKYFTGEDKVDPFVEVSFGSLLGKTSVKNSYAPVWNEQIIFSEMFPPDNQIIKIQLKDYNKAKESYLIGTHFIDLKTISNDEEEGFLPTFGPAFVHFYGSIRVCNLTDDLAILNEGEVEGVAYRGRILLSIRTEITDSIQTVPEVKMESISPINQAACIKNEEIFLFSSILNATIDKNLESDSLYFEISIGNDGNAIDGHNEPCNKNENDNLESVSSYAMSCHSTTSPTKPMTHDGKHYFLPYQSEKPCLYVRSMWPVYIRRMYNSNVISKIVDKMEEDLNKVHRQMTFNDPNVEHTLKCVLEDLSNACKRYCSKPEGAVSRENLGKTELDEERMKLCLREIENIGKMSEKSKKLVKRNFLKDSYKTAHTYLKKLKFLIEDPQHSLPDIFVWMVSSGKRIAYKRISARDLIYSIVDEECGKKCGKVETLHLKLPAIESSGTSGWAIQAKLQLYMWLGLNEYKANCINGLPKGYKPSDEIENADSPSVLPPLVIHYIENHVFQLRAHMYQARCLIGSDESGLSDPFVRVIFGEYSKSTQVIKETLIPIWDELLLFDQILIYGRIEDILKDPPTVNIEIFDQDQKEESEFIGRTIAKPHVKLAKEAYAKPNFPPSLEWFKINRGSSPAGELLATFELFELSGDTETTALPSLPPPKETERSTVLPVPPGIRPTLAKYRIEVIFWGLRDLSLGSKPRVEIECAGQILYSSVIQNPKKNLNFSSQFKILDLEFPEQELYCPPLIIKAVDIIEYGRSTLIGTHTVHSIHPFMYIPMTENKTASKKRSLKQILGFQTNSSSSHQSDIDDEQRPLLSSSQSSEVNGTSHPMEDKQPHTKDVDDDKESGDWWTKYYEKMIKIYPNELESQLDYNGFEDRMLTFNLYRGKNTGNNEMEDESRNVGKFKGAIKAYKWPLPEDEELTVMDPELGFFHDFPQNDPIQILVRVYIVQAKDLRPSNKSGDANPYPVLQLGSENKNCDYVPHQLNPVFGKCFEFKAKFPQDSSLTVQIFDSVVGPDVMIGETKIDLENRFYSSHRATCGIAKNYEEVGYNQWRDPMKPTDILAKLCSDGKIDCPSYKKNKVIVENQTFSLTTEELSKINGNGLEEHLALKALHNWKEIPRIGCQLVPEHIETRPLYNPEKPGIEQGKLEMWVDMFPMDMRLPGPPIDISPRKPKSYELRVIIWNTDDVVLDDDAFITGEKMSDIYVKGWLKDPEDCMSTDVHYRSLTGEGNFNWRFVFPFEYLGAEKKMVTSRKEYWLFGDKTEYKIPAELKLEVWDSDSFSADDYLGAIALDLNRFPRGAKSSKCCKLSMLKTDKPVPMVNLFKKKRAKGWWPFYIEKENGERELRGKVEAELHLLTKEEAEKYPVGTGRDEPEPLEKPNRPTSSFLWFQNPLKSIRYIFWRNYKRTIFKVLLIILFALLLMKFFYSIPGYAAKKLLNV